MDAVASTNVTSIGRALIIIITVLVTILAAHNGTGRIRCVHTSRQRITGINGAVQHVVAVQEDVNTAAAKTAIVCTCTAIIAVGIRRTSIPARLRDILTVTGGGITEITRARDAIVTDNWADIACTVNTATRYAELSGVTVRVRCTRRRTRRGHNWNDLGNRYKRTTFVFITEVIEGTCLAVCTVSKAPQTGTIRLAAIDCAGITIVTV